MFRVKAAYSFEVGGLLVRMYAFMRTIGTVSMLTLSGYSYFMAGLVASVVAFALFLISPRVSKKIDERGQGAIVLPATCIALLGCAILLVTVLLKLPIALCFVGAALMGFLPTPQALTRARWVYLVKSGRLGDDAPELKTVFSYEGVMDDIVFMVSPALSIALASGIHPIAGMGCGFICCVVGTLLLVSSKDTQVGKRGWRTGKVPRLPSVPKVSPPPSPAPRLKAREAEVFPQLARTLRAVLPRMRSTMLSRARESAPAACSSRILWCARCSSCRF